MRKNHNYFLNLAHQLAERNLGKTGLNPTVGTVVVKDDTVVSTGVTSVNGRPHSEFNALSKLENFVGATLYTTLEPCVHFGKTPPCTNIIIKKKIKNVFYGHEDPDKRTFRKAKKTLNLNGIKATFIKSPNCKNLYKSYLVNKKLNIPFISAKIAISKDHYSINKKNKWITNHKSRRIVHLLRSKHDCILSTSKTINSDNSLLNCRIHGLDNFKPDLFIIDLHLKLRKDLSLLKLIKKRKTFLITNKINYKKSLTFKKMGYKIVLIDSLNSKKEFISLYNKIYKLGYSRVLVETGLFFLKTLINNNVVNDLYMFKNNTILKQRGKNNVSPNFLKQIKFKKVLINLDNDKLYKKEF
jgi:diaminohydroxyphosphoribosylaminopyrimidine deaminase/5-amino-6-(5-phosphoribosylamino)uracil reductase